MGKGWVNRNHLLINIVCLLLGLFITIKFNICTLLLTLYSGARTQSRAAKNSKQNKETCDSKGSKILSLDNLASYEDQLKLSYKQRKPARTPSGGATFSPVNQTRKVFSPSKEIALDQKRRKDLLRRSKRLLKSTEHDYSTSSENSVYERHSSMSTLTLGASAISDPLNQNTAINMFSNNSLTPPPLSEEQGDKRKRKQTEEAIQERMDFDVNDQRSPSNSCIQSKSSCTNNDAEDVKDATPKRYKRDVKSDDLCIAVTNAMSKLIQEGITKDNLQTIDVRSVHGMFQQIASDIQLIKQETSSELEGFKTKMKTEVEKDVNTLLLNQELEIKELRKELGNVQKRAALAENVLIYNQAVTNDIIKKLDGIELNNTRKMAVLSGFPTSAKKI